MPIPSGNIKASAVNCMIMSCVAKATSPIKPEMICAISNDHHSTQTLKLKKKDIVEGEEDVKDGYTS